MKYTTEDGVFWFDDTRISLESFAKLFRRDSGDYVYYLHRLNEPAIEWNSGTKEWYYNRKIHRIGGPAYDNPEGYQHWYVNGLCHRIDGPAQIYPGNIYSWYLAGKLYNFKDWLELTPISDEEKLEIKLMYS